jgi:hypothetical protein
MGGQACVFYGAAEFSRDLDLLILIDPDNIARLRIALDDLDAVPIAVPSLDPNLLNRGHAVHFRCRRSDVEGLRIDLMSSLRGVAEFEELWERRTTIEVDGAPASGSGGDRWRLIPDFKRARRRGTRGTTSRSHLLGAFEARARGITARAMGLIQRSAVDRLEHGGMVRRTASPADGRQGGGRASHRVIARYGSERIRGQDLYPIVDPDRQVVSGVTRRDLRKLFEQTNLAGSTLATITERAPTGSTGRRRHGSSAWGCAGLRQLCRKRAERDRCPSIPLVS